MKKITKIFLFALLFGLSTNPLSTNAYTYTDYETKYQLEIPQGWMEIPLSAIEELNLYNKKYFGKDTQVFKTGFQQKSKEIMQGSYVLIQTIDTPGYIPVIGNKPERNKFNFNEFVKDFKNDPQFIFLDADYSNKIIKTKHKEEVVEELARKDNIKNPLSQFSDTRFDFKLGKRKSLRLFFYERNSKGKDKYEQLLNSIRFDQPFPEKTNTLSKRASTSSVIERGFSGTITAAVIFIIGAILSGVISLFSKLTKKENNIDENTKHNNIQETDKKSIPKKKKKSITWTIFWIIIAILPWGFITLAVIYS